jgi:DNA-binding YbaB/EbfC family protein
MAKGKKNRGSKMPRGMGGGMGGGMGNLLNQMQKLQEDMAQTQAELESEELTVTAGGGIVTLVITGQRKVKSLEIDPEVVDPDDVEMLQDVVVAAINDALEQVEKLQEERMGGLTGGLDLPPGLGI